MSAKPLTLAFTLVLCVAMIIVALPVNTSAETGVIQVYTLEDLNDVRDNLGGNYLLMNDIDASETASWAEGWRPIGIFNEFLGVFDGNGHIITDLVINTEVNQPTLGWGYGLFGKIGIGGLVKNLGVSVNITGELLAQAGGIAGRSEGEVRNCYSLGHMETGYETGGLVGQNKGLITSSFSQVNIVTSETTAGGLVGFNDGTIINSFATGYVTAIMYVGGLVGTNNGEINHSYSAGLPVGLYGPSGGLVGNSNGGSTNGSYWDVDSSNKETSAGGVGKTTAQMRQKSTFEGWDFDEIWTIAEGFSYPYHRYMMTVEEPEDPTVIDDPVDETPDDTDDPFENSTQLQNIINEFNPQIDIDISGMALAVLAGSVLIVAAVTRNPYLACIGIAFALYVGLDAFGYGLGDILEFLKSRGE